MTIAETPSNRKAALAADAAIAAYLRALADQRAAELTRPAPSSRVDETSAAPLPRRRYERINDFSRTSFFDLRELARRVSLLRLAVNSRAGSPATLTRAAR